MFDALAGGLLGGVFNLIGGSNANATNRAIANAQMDFQAESQQNQMDFGREMVGRQEDFQRESIGRQEGFQREMFSSARDYATQMSNTSYQRGMADMRAAGLNPILAYAQGGATAPTVGAPSGAGASGASASVSAMPGASTRVENVLGPAIASAVQGARVSTELQQLAANVRRTNAETALIGEQQHQVQSNTALQTAQAITEGVRPDLIRAQTRTEHGRPALVGAQTAQARSSARANEAQGDLTEQRATQYRNYGPPTTIGDNAGAGEAMARRGLSTSIGGAAYDAVRRGLEGLLPWLR